MTEEPYLPAPSKSQEPDQAAETVSAEQEEFEVEVEERESYQERTSGSYTDSYEEGSGSVAGYRIPYRLMREGSPPPPANPPGPRPTPGLQQVSPQDNPSGDQSVQAAQLRVQCLCPATSVAG